MSYLRIVISFALIGSVQICLCGYLINCSVKLIFFGVS